MSCVQKSLKKTKEKVTVCFFSSQRQQLHVVHGRVLCAAIGQSHGHDVTDVPDVTSFVVHYDALNGMMIVMTLTVVPDPTRQRCYNQADIVYSDPGIGHTPQHTQSIIFCGVCARVGLTAPHLSPAS